MAPSGRPNGGLCSAGHRRMQHCRRSSQVVGSEIVLCRGAHRARGDVCRPPGAQSACSDRRRSNVLFLPATAPPQSAAPVVHPCIKVSAPQLYLSFQEARQPEPQRFRRKELGSNERFWQQSPKWNVSKPHACPLGLSVNKPLSIRGRRGPRPGAETAY